MITTLAFNEADQSRAERLFDCIYWLGNCEQLGHILLVPGPDVHAEFKLKVKIAASVAFRSVDVLELPSVRGANKTEHINFLFKSAARYIVDCYREPFLWLEADCVPLKPDWFQQIRDAYEAQPRRYMGRFMQGKAQGNSDGRFLHRVAVYPNNAINDLAGYMDGAPPFERVANIIPRCTMSTLFHIEKYQPDMKLDAALLNGDRSGVLVEQIIEGCEGPKELVKVRTSAKSAK